MGFSFEIKLERREHSAELAMRALAGDAEAAASLVAITAWLGHYRASRRGGVLCFTCARRLRRAPDTILVMVPLQDGTAVCGGICDPCSLLPGAELTQSILSTFRKLSPSAELRVVPLHGGGRA
jgi:hypothetical protein